MRINNPKTTAGGLPLATTWYVNSRHAEQKEYIDSISAFLSGYTDEQVSNATAASIARDEAISAASVARDEALSAQSDIRDNEVVSALLRYITGSGNVPAFVEEMFTNFPADPEDPSIYYTPKKFGYAYLAENKKIDPSLMPDISIMDVTVTDIEDLFVYLKDKNYLAHDKELYKTLAANPTDLQTILTTVKKCLEIYIKDNQSLTGDIKVFGSGDLLVITNFGKDNIAADLATDAYKLFADVFSQSYACGAWICNAETRVKEGERANLNDTISFVKSSYNQGEITSVNGLVPMTDGNITITLPNLYRRDGSKIGETLAKNLEQVKSIDDDPNAMRDLSLEGGLVNTIDVSNRFVFDDEVHANCFAYTTINEFMTLNVATETVRANLSAALDEEKARAIAAEELELSRATTAESQISAAFDAEVARSTAYDEYLSGVVGDEAALSGVTVTSALVALKAHADTTAANVQELKTIVNTTDYDVLKVYTQAFASGNVSDIKASAPGTLTITAKNFALEHTIEGFNDVYEGNIYNYFGIKPAEGCNDVAEITFSGFEGKILDIYVEKDGKFEKIDADINYVETPTDNFGIKTTASFTIIAEYNSLTAGPESAVLDKMVVRYTNKFEYEPADTNPLFA